MILYITNKARTVFLPYEEGMIEWLHENYPLIKIRQVHHGVQV